MVHQTQQEVGYTGTEYRIPRNPRGWIRLPRCLRTTEKGKRGCPGNTQLLVQRSVFSLGQVDFA